MPKTVILSAVRTPIAKLGGGLTLSTIRTLGSGVLVHELRRRGGGLGAAAICSGDAVIVEVNGS